MWLAVCVWIVSLNVLIMSAGVRIEVCIVKGSNSRNAKTLILNIGSFAVINNHMYYNIIRLDRKANV